MELLVVIGIIGILAGLIFPVAAGARRRAKQTQCINNMYQIFTALKQFQLDEHRYPEYIAGPVQWQDPKTKKYSYIKDSGVIVPINESTGMVGGSNGGNGRAVALYPEYITAANMLKCPYSDLNGDFNSNMAINSLGNSRPYSPGVSNGIQDDKSIAPDPMYPILSSFTMGPVPFRGIGLNQDLNGDSNADGKGALWVYKYSSYDYQKPPKIPNPSDEATTGQARYSPAWADYDPTKDLASQPGVPRQLRWRTPPEDTVITWCSYHRDVDAMGVPKGGSRDLVLFLDGHVDLRPSPSMEPWTTGWRMTP